MSTPLSIYMYPETTGWVAGIEQVRLNYKAGVSGLQSISPLTYDIVLDSPEDAVNGVFETLETALQYYLLVAGPIIESAVNTATGGDYFVNSEVRFEPQDGAAHEYRLQGIDALSSTIQSNYTEIESEISGLNAALSDLSNELHPIIGDMKRSRLSSDHARWMKQDGRALLQETFPQLFAVLGTTYNTMGDDNMTDFRLPTLQADEGNGIYDYIWVDTY